ncbi:MAG: UDP-3-O-(3-hydroxymyristoyl)glucosamine N-acyltransferase [Acetobacteraceae bacterium]
MAPDPRFFGPGRGPLPLGDIAAACGATLAGAAQPSRLIDGIAALQSAGPGEITFLDNPRYVEALAASRAGACILAPDHAPRAPAGMALLVTAKPYLAWARVAALFHPPQRDPAGLHPTAVIAPDALIGRDVAIGAGAVIGAGAAIGDRTSIGPLAAIGPGVVLGRDCRIGAGTSVSHTIAGDRVTLHPGARLGQDGFGFAEGPAGFVSVPQLGRILIGDDVEIGANTTIDRGSAGDTVIGSGTRMDNLVQIGHNVRLGRGCVIVAQVGIAGSTVLGDFVVVAGQAGFTGHLRVGSGARIGAQSGVMNDVPPGATWVGSPARPARDTLRAVAALQRLAREGRRKAG